MTQAQIDALLPSYMDKLPYENIEYVKQTMLNATDDDSINFAFAKMKDPTTALILSILCGGWGIDRFYIGDIGLGVCKLLTCGGIYVWWIIDMIMIMNATRQRNLETFMTCVH